MAPNPNECVGLMQSRQDTTEQQQQQMTAVENVLSPPPQVIKTTVTTCDESSEDGEHFYDAASEVNSDADVNDQQQQQQQQQKQPGSPTNGKDSGVENDKENGAERDFEMPDEQLSAQIVQQVEYYFSDAHILKDAFLLKHARRNRDGYISLKLITSFKKVKHVSKDWRVVAVACRQSSQLEINESGTKVRRVAPLPESDETSPSRTVVAIGIQADKASIEGVAEIMSAASHGGTIALIRLLRPGSAVPPDVRQCANRNADILTSVCAVVEFEAADSARQALRHFGAVCDASAHAQPFNRLVELAAKRANSNKNTPNSSRPVTPSSSPSSSSSSSFCPSPSPPTPPSSPDHQQQLQAARRRRARGPVAARNRTAVQNVMAAAQDHGASASSSASDAEDKSSPFNRRKHFYMNVNNMNSNKNNNSVTYSTSQGSTPSQSPLPRRHVTISVNSSPRMTFNASAGAVDSAQRNRQKSTSCSEPSSPASHSPWVQRRMAADQSSANASGFVSDNRLSVPSSNIVRLPHGPDGTRGFRVVVSQQQQENKPRSASAPEVPRPLLVTSF